jgi:hypothetical protein
VGASTAGEAELPGFCRGLVAVMDRLIHSIGVDLAGPAAVDTSPNASVPPASRLTSQSASRARLLNSYDHDRCVPYGATCAGLLLTKLADLGKRGVAGIIVVEDTAFTGGLYPPIALV